MPDPQRQSPPERPDPSALLIDAVIQRQSDLAQRLAQQWVHRRGWPSLEAFLQGPLRQSCGLDALAWLRQRLGLEAAAKTETETHQTSSAPTTGLAAVLREALSEAIAPLQQGLPAAAARPAMTLISAAGAAEADPWQLSELEPTTRIAPKRTGAAAQPAPAPADLASLRQWLHSDAA